MEPRGADYDTLDDAYLAGASAVLMYLEREGVITWEQHRDAYRAIEAANAPSDDDDDDEEEGWTEADTQAEIDADLCPHCGLLGFATGGCACDRPMDAWGRPLTTGKGE